MIWILLIIQSVSCGGNFYNMAIEFDSQRACEQAKSQLNDNCREIICVPKGETKSNF